MTIFLRVIASVLVALIFSSVHESRYSDGLPGLIMLFAVNVMVGALPLLGFVCLVLLPIEAVLSRFNAGPAMVAIASLLGWGLPHLAVFVAPNQANAMAALPALTTLGTSCGVIWGVTAMIPKRYRW